MSTRPYSKQRFIRGQAGRQHRYDYGRPVVDRPSGSEEPRTPIAMPRLQPPNITSEVALRDRPIRAPSSDTGSTMAIDYDPRTPPRPPFSPRPPSSPGFDPRAFLHAAAASQQKHITDMHQSINNSIVDLRNQIIKASMPMRQDDLPQSYQWAKEDIFKLNREIGEQKAHFDRALQDKNEEITKCRIELESLQKRSETLEMDLLECKTTLERKKEDYDVALQEKDNQIMQSQSEINELNKRLAEITPSIPANHRPEAGRTDTAEMPEGLTPSCMTLEDHTMGRYVDFITTVKLSCVMIQRACSLAPGLWEDLQELGYFIPLGVAQGDSSDYTEFKPIMGVSESQTEDYD